jgi:hypothetical protein
LLTPKLEAPTAVETAVQPYAISSAIRHSSKHVSSRPPVTSHHHILFINENYKHSQKFSCLAAKIKFMRRMASYTHLDYKEELRRK